MSALKKLIKTTDGLEAEVQDVTDKAVAKAVADVKKYTKLRLTAAIADAKGAGHPKEVKTALVNALTGLKTELAS